MRCSWPASSFAFSYIRTRFRRMWWDFIGTNVIMNLSVFCTRWLWIHAANIRWNNLRGTRWCRREFWNLCLLARNIRILCLRTIISISQSVWILCLCSSITIRPLDGWIDSFIYYFPIEFHFKYCCKAWWLPWIQRFILDIKKLWEYHINCKQSEWCLASSNTSKKGRWSAWSYFCTSLVLFWLASRDSVIWFVMVSCAT